MIFSTKDARKGFKSKNVPFMAGGIHEDVTMSDILIDKTANGQYYARFVYTDPQGMILNHSEFEPKRGPFQSDEDFQEKINSQINRIVNNQLIPYFGYKDGVKMDEEWVNNNLPSYEGSSFFGYLNWLKETIEQVAKTTKLRIKVVYDNKGYTQLPKYSVYTSVEPMSADKRLITELSIDNFKPVPVDNEKTIDPLTPSNISQANVSVMDSDVISNSLVGDAST